MGQRDRTRAAAGSPDAHEGAPWLVSQPGSAVGWRARSASHSHSSAVSSGAASAVGQPEVFGPDTGTYSFIGFECDGFDILIEGTGTQTFTAWFDADGNFDHGVQRTRAPHDTLTNTVTGQSIVVRGEFNERVDYDAATDTWLKTITGFRYMVNVPGTGVTIRDVGRILYGDLEQTIVLWEAGEHDLALDEQFWGTFCGALD